MTTLRQQTETNATMLPVSSAICLALIIGGLISSLFFQKVNAEFFALSGLSLVAAFMLALWTGQRPQIDRNILPLILMFLFWGWIGVATIFSPVSFISQGTFWTIAFLPFTALTIVLVSGKPGFEAATKAALFVVVSALAIYACTKYFVFDSPPRATFANKNNFAALQIPMVFFAAGAAVRAGRIFTQLLFLALASLFIFTIGIIGSRAVMICLVIGLVLIFVFLFKDRWPRKRVIALLATVIISILASNLAGSGALAKRTETMLSPSSAGTSRFLIWEGSLELAKDTPWHGIGPGLYPMVYPKYRLDEDKSAAFFVHNDYLQFFIEAGWPAPILLIAGLIALAVLGFGRVLRKHLTRDQRIEILVTLLGIGAIAGHSLLSFNLFLPSLLIISGILIGIVTYRLQDSDKSQSLKVPTNKIPRLFALFIALLLVTPSIYFLETGRSTLIHKEATRLRENNRPVEAIEALKKASKASPEADLYHYSLAWLLYEKIVSEEKIHGTKTPETITARLDRAEELNPLRPQIHTFRARILEGLGDPQSGENWKSNEKLRAQIETEYRQAVAKDPFYLEGRFYLARFLLQQNRLEEGLTVLENGIEKPYLFNELSVNYYRLTAEMRRILGDQEGYQSLMDRLKAAIEKKKRQSKKPATSS